nr:immunoglobulin heavy chain junction region [Macaca mulatta]
CTRQRGVIIPYFDYW